MARVHRLRRRGGLALLVLVLGTQFLVVADASIMNLALPSIQAALDFSPSGLQWVLSAYVLTYGGLLLLGGRLADLVGPRRVLLAGLGTFGATALVGGVAPVPTVLVAARAVQGLGAALIAPATLVLINTTLQDERRRRRALGWWGAVNAAGFAGGVLLGGVLVQYFSWRAALLVNIPAAGLAAAAALRLLPTEPAPIRARFDVSGAMAITAAVALLVYGCTRAPEAGWSSSATLTSLGLAVLLAVGFVLREMRTAAPVVPLRVFRRSSVSAANAVVILFGLCAGVGLFFLLSLYMQQIWGYTPMATGLAFLPLGGLILASAPLVGRALSRVPPRLLLLPGLGLLAGGLGWMSLLTTQGRYLTGLLPGLVLLGLGYGPVLVTSVTVATASFSYQEQGLASGLINTTTNVAGALGTALYTTLAQTSAATTHAPNTTAFATGYTTAFTLGMVFALCAIPLALATFPTRLPTNDKTVPLGPTRSSDRP